MARMIAGAAIMLTATQKNLTTSYGKNLQKICSDCSLDRADETASEICGSFPLRARQNSLESAACPAHHLPPKQKIYT